MASHDDSFQKTYEKILIIKNTGESEARNIEIMFNKTPHSEYHGVAQRSRNPIPNIGPHSEIKLYLTDRNLPHSLDLLIKWDDDYEYHRKHPTTLTK